MGESGLQTVNLAQKEKFSESPQKKSDKILQLLVVCHVPAAADFDGQLFC